MEFLRGLKGRGLDGVKLVISDAYTGLKAAIQRIFQGERPARHRF
jgi:transposase-like protein